jgi:DNA-binding NtrC family response regulator
VCGAPLQRRILLVGLPSPLGAAIADAIRHSGHCLSVATTFHSAKSHLSYAPDLVITDLKLGEYNGLQLAMRSLAAGIPVVVVADACFERDVEQLGARWMSRGTVAITEIQSVLRDALQDAAPRNRCGWFESPALVSLDAMDGPGVLH